MLSMASGNCKLLSVVNADVGTKTCVIPLNISWFDDYSAFVIMCDVKFVDTPSTNEWFYVTYNTTATLSGRYVGVVDKVKQSGRIMCAVGATIFEDKIRLSKLNDVTNYDEYQIDATNNYFAVQLWTNTFEADSTVKVYGIK